MKQLFFISLLFFCAKHAAHAEEVLLTEPDSTYIESDTSEQKKSIFYRAFNQTRPVTGLAFPLVYYTPETNLMFGVAAVVSWRQNKDSTNAASYVVPWLTYSIDKQIIAEGFGTFYWKSNRNQVEYEVSYRKEKMPFYGVGNRLYKEKDSKELVSMQRFRTFVSYQHRFKDMFLVGAKYSLDYTYDVRPEEGGQLDTNNYLGKSRGFVHGLGLKATFDNRDDMYFPFKGNYFDVEYLGYPKFLGSKYQFSSLQADYRTFLNIKRKVVLATHVTAQMGFGDMPYYMMPALGGKHILRGYTQGSSRDLYMFNIQGELRVPLNRFILTGFFGNGTVGEKFGDYFKLKDYSYSIGGGVRFRPFTDKNIAARLDVGFWQKTFGFYFVLNEAF